VTTLCLDLDLRGRASVSSGASDLARAMAERTKSAFADYLRTARGQHLFDGAKSELAASLVDARELASMGEGVAPSAAALKEAHDLIDSLPESFARPRVGIEPSGAIGFEWDFGPGRFAILALKGTGVLECSFSDGPGDETWGNKNFAGALDARTLRTLAELGAIR